MLATKLYDETEVVFCDKPSRFMTCLEISARSRILLNLIVDYGICDVETGSI